MKQPGYYRKIEARAKAAFDRGEPTPCTCWDCLRADGITPIGPMRDRHKRLYPPVVFREVDGRPAPVGGGSRTVRAHDPEAQAHLKEAVRNRAVI